MPVEAQDPGFSSAESYQRWAAASAAEEGEKKARQVLLGEEFFAFPQISCQSASRQLRKGQQAEQVIWCVALEQRSAQRQLRREGDPVWARWGSEALRYSIMLMALIA